MEHGAHTCLCVKSAISKLTGWKASKQHQHHLVVLTTEESLKREKEARHHGRGRAAQSKGTSVTLRSWGTIPQSVEPVSGTNAQLTRESAEHINLEMKPKTGAQGWLTKTPSVGGKTTLLLRRQDQPSRCLDLHPGLKREPRQALPP